MKKKVFIGIIIVLILIQFIPIKRENPPSLNEIQDEEAVISIFKRSCYDCHSNYTKYPNYSYIAPISFILQHHINEGREELNFSDWNTLTPKKKSTKAYDIVEEIENGEMPIKGYVLFHKEAKINESDIDIIKKWAERVDEEFLKSNEK